MRKKGTIDEVRFVCNKWCIRHLSYEYKLSDGNSSELIYVDTMKELRTEIAKYKGFEQYEQSEIRVRPMQSKCESQA